MGGGGSGGRYQLGVDIGGTFTDLVLMDAERRRIAVGKTLTTVEDPAIGVLEGIRDLLADAEAEARDVGRIFHATTLATNALIERKGARTALLTTAGFRDVIEIRDEGRFDLFDLFLEMPRPLVPRELRFEVRERILADGSVATPLDDEEARRTIRTLASSGVEAVAISLLHSYRNPIHEQRLEQLVGEIAPAMRVSRSSDVAPEIREYPRTSTTVANVYIRELVERYLRSLEHGLQALGIPADLFVMLSSGGACSIETACRYPVRLVESGPAAGVLGAALNGSLIGRSNLLSFDMGGTTAKACLIHEGTAQRASVFEFDRVGRFKKGSGLPIQAPVIELVEIGAGGGSIARVDQLGRLQVGPGSAGAQPGPACYGLGGTDPTVTDADLVLGYLDPGFFLGGSMALDVDAARAAIDRAIAVPLDRSLVDASWAIHQMVSETMAIAARVAAVERGRDPRGYPLFAFGGAGPVHAQRVAQILRAPAVVVPLGAGVASASGLLCAPLAFDFARTWQCPLASMDWEAANALYRAMEDEGRRVVTLAGVDESSARIERSIDVRYAGQGYEVNVPVPPGDLRLDASPRIVAAFERAYRERYGHTLPGIPLEVVSWRSTVAGPGNDPSLIVDAFLALHGDTGVADGALKGSRLAYFPEHGGYVDVEVYDRYRLSAGTVLEGPAIVEERESTTIVAPGGRLTVDAARNLVIDLPDHG
jgi:N-methylhydantoinase A